MAVEYKEYLFTDEEATRIMHALIDLELILASVPEARDLSAFDSFEVAGIYELVSEQLKEHKAI